MLKNAENTPYVTKIEETLKELGSDSSFTKLVNDFEVLNSDPNFLKIFVPVLVKSLMTAEKANLELAVTCLGEAETFLDNMTVPMTESCPVWAMAGLTPGQKINIPTSAMSPTPAPTTIILLI